MGRLLRWCFAVLLLAASTAHASEKRNVMVLPFYGTSVREEVLNGLQAIFQDAAAKLPGITVVQVNSRALMIINECAGDPQCLGKGLARQGADHFIFTEVVKLPQKGAGFELHQSIHTAPTGGHLRDSTQVLRGNGAQLDTLAFRAAASLISPEQLKGGVQVEVNVGGASIFVDGKRVATSPMAGAYGGLTEGRHKLKVEKDDYSTQEQPFEVSFGEVTSLDVRLTRDMKAVEEAKANPASPSRPFPVYALVVPAVGTVATLVLTVLAAGVGGGFLGATAYLAESISTKARANTLMFPKDEGTYRAWQAVSALAVVAFVAAAVILVVGALGTAAATVGALVFHFVRPPPEAPPEEFKDRTVVRPREASPRQGKRKAAVVEEEEEDAPRAPPKKQQKPFQAVPDDALPDGE